MPTLETAAPPDEIRATTVLIGDDAALYRAIAVKRAAETNSTVKHVDIMREAVRCYAEKLQVNAT